jgi:hypothetical protein
MINTERMKNSVLEMIKIKWNRNIEAKETNVQRIRNKTLRRYGHTERTAKPRWSKKTSPPNRMCKTPNKL